MWFGSESYMLVHSCGTVTLFKRYRHIHVTNVQSTCSLKPLPPAVANSKTLVHKYCNTSHFQLDLLTDSLCA